MSINLWTSCLEIRHGWFSGPYTTTKVWTAMHHEVLNYWGTRKTPYQSCMQEGKLFNRCEWNAFRHFSTNVIKMFTLRYTVSPYSYATKARLYVPTKLQLNRHWRLLENHLYVIRKTLHDIKKVDMGFFHVMIKNKKLQRECWKTKVYPI